MAAHKPTLIAIIKHKSVYLDIAIVLLAMLLTYFFAGHINLAEKYIGWAELGESYQLDELIFVLLSGGLALVWYSWRRINDLKLTIQKNIQMQNALRTSKDNTAKLLEKNQDLIRHMALVRENERQHLANELHDVFGQHLAALNANLAAAGQFYESKDLLKNVHDSMHESVTYLTEITRNKLRNLKPPRLDSIGLSGSISELLKSWKNAFPNYEINAEVTINDDRIHEEAGLAVYRTVQEGLVNIKRHAKASKIKLVLTGNHQDDTYHLTLHLENDGDEINLDTVGEGLGLLGIKARSEKLGGYFSIEPIGINQGTRLLLKIPCSSQEKE